MADSENAESVAVIGAGLTGRGFVGRLLAERGRPFLLIDRDRELVERLRRASSYDVRFFADSRPPLSIADYSSLVSDDPLPDGIVEALDTIFVSVGARNLPEVGRYLKRFGARRRKMTRRPCAVVACENAPNAVRALAAGISESGDDPAPQSSHYPFVLVGAAVFCTTTHSDPGGLDLLSEDYAHLEYDASVGWKGASEFSFLHPVSDMDKLMKRKLFTYNALSAILAYAGWWKGYAFLSEAIDDPQIRALTDRYTREIDAAIVDQLQVDERDQKAFSKRAIEKFSNPLIADSIRRNAREASRKLSEGERIVGALALLRRANRDYTVLIETAALMLAYSHHESAGPKSVGPVGAGPGGDWPESSGPDSAGSRTAAGELSAMSGLPAQDDFVRRAAERYLLLSKAGPGKL